jgi:RND family efflux transporter MFP subunit
MHCISRNALHHHTPGNAVNPPRRRLLLGTVCFLGALAWGCAPAAPPPEEERPAVVKAAAARALLLGEWVELLGTTQPLPNHDARVTAAVEGRVLTVLGSANSPHVSEGQRVKSGDVIAQLDDRIPQADRAKAAAALLDLVEQRKQANIAVESAKLTLASKQELAKKSPDLVPKLEMDMAHLALQDAESRLRGIDAKETAGKADLKLVDEKLKHYTLRAPIDGRLGLLQVVPGQTLVVGNLVAEVVNLNEIDVLCFVPPHTAARLALNQPARLVGRDDVPATSSAGGQGKVIYISEEAQPETGNFAVKVRFVNKDLKLRSNTVQRLEVQTQPEKERFTIKEAALIEDQDPPVVVIIEKLETIKNKETDKDEEIGVARRLRATIGVRNRRQGVVEILSLEDPETKQTFSVEDANFVIEGGQGLETGDKVKLEAEEEE